MLPQDRCRVNVATEEGADDGNSQLSEVEDMAAAYKLAAEQGFTVKRGGKDKISNDWAYAVRTNPAVKVPQFVHPAIFI